MLRETKLITALQTLGIVVGMALTLPVFAESAPVYDADAMQQQSEQPDTSNIGRDQQASNDQVNNDQANEQGAEFPMPPAPGQENTFAQSPGTAAPVPPPMQMQAPATSPAIVSSASDHRLKRLEDQIKTLQTDSAAARVDSLQQEVRSLRGQVEELTHQLKQAQSQQKSMYADLDKRVSSNKTVVADNTPAAATDAGIDIPAEKPAAAAKPARVALAATKSTDKPAAAPAANQQPNVAEEQQIYQTAYNLIKAKKYNEAINALQGMLKKYPTGQFASNAHYWLGELYGLVGKNDQALTEFNIVVKNYSTSPRVSDAQLKIGLIYAAQVKWSEAKSAFKKVINQYPGSASAKLAAIQLKQIKDAGH